MFQLELIQKKYFGYNPKIKGISESVSDTDKLAEIAWVTIRTQNIVDKKSQGQIKGRQFD